MGATPVYNLPYLDDNDPPDIPLDGEQSMLAVEAELARIDGTAAGAAGDITGLGVDLAALAVLVADRVPVRMGRFKSSTGGTIATSEAVEATCTISIPAGWNTYDLDGFGLCRIVATGGPSGATTVTHQLRLGTTTAGSSGAVSSTYVNITSPGPAAGIGAIGGDWAGLTATGTVSVVWTMIANNNNGLWSWDDIYMKLFATRLT